jgi:hypothetical protein
MDFADKIEELADRIPNQLKYCTTEEATKNALILPFIQSLGYDVFNPTEVIPELTADFGTKKGEKVDYAILQHGDPIIIFECKSAGTDLGDAHTSQLYRYFSVLPKVRFGVLTNGVLYHFYSDLDAPNRMDDTPFFIFDMVDYQEQHVNELKKFTKTAFDVDVIRATASELKYTAAIKRIISGEFDDPSEKFVKFLSKQVYSGRMTQNVKDQFTDITRRALRRFLNDRISDRLKSALEVTGKDETITIVPSEETAESDATEGTEEERKDGIVTTQEEIEGYFAVKSILRDTIDVKRVYIRDTKTYCNVLLDDKRTKPICRLFFNRSQKYLAIFDENKNQERVPIVDIDDIYDHSKRIVTTVQSYDSRYGIPSARPKAVSSSAQSKSTDSYTGKKLQAFFFGQQRYTVNSWRQAMLQILELLHNRDPALFQRQSITMVGKIRPYITADSSELRHAGPISDTNLYVELNLSSQMIAGLCVGLATKMGLDTTSISFEVI